MTYYYIVAYIADGGLHTAQLVILHQIEGMFDLNWNLHMDLVPIEHESLHNKFFIGQRDSGMRISLILLPKYDQWAEYYTLIQQEGNVLSSLYKGRVLIGLISPNYASVSN